MKKPTPGKGFVPTMKSKKVNLKDPEISLEDLQSEIERRKAEAIVPRPRIDPNYMSLHDMIVEGVKEAATSQYFPKDFKHYVYEEAMNAVYGDTIWKWINSNNIS